MVIAGENPKFCNGLRLSHRKGIGALIAAEARIAHAGRVEQNNPPIDPKVRQRMVEGGRSSASEYAGMINLRRGLTTAMDV